MPTFDTPAPISVTVELGVGDIQIVASDRTDTTVEIRPSDPARKSDVTAAEHTRVECANGMLLIKAPKGWRQYTSRGFGESVDVQIDVPAGSHLQVDAGVASLRGIGRLGECRYRTGVGNVQVDQTGPLEVKTGVGDVGVVRAVGRTEIATGSGAVRIERVDGTAMIKNANGDTWIGEVVGDLRVSAANGKIEVGQAHATVAAKAAKGDVRLDRVERGAVVAQCGFGNVDIAIRDRAAAWLDLNTAYGNVKNSLDPADGPEPGEDAVEVRARTSYGDITIRRAFAKEDGNREA